MGDLSKHSPMDDIRGLLSRQGLNRVTVERDSSLVTAKSDHFQLTVYDDRNPAQKDLASGAEPSIACVFVFTLLPEGSETDSNSRNAWRLNMEEAEKFACGRSSGGQLCNDFPEFERRLTSLLPELRRAAERVTDPEDLRRTLRVVRFS